MILHYEKKTNNINLFLSRDQLFLEAATMSHSHEISINTFDKYL